MNNAHIFRPNLSFEKAALKRHGNDSWQKHEETLKRIAEMEDTIDPPEQIKVILTKPVVVQPK